MGTHSKILDYLRDGDCCGRAWGALEMGAGKVQTLDAMKEANLALLHDRLYQGCKHYIAQGHIDVDSLKNIEYLYRAYHALGGNGTGTELYTRVQKLPIKED